MLEVRRVRAGEWRELRALRLESLQDSPSAFWKRYEEEVDAPDEQWHEWIASTFVAVEDGRLVGMAAGASDSGQPNLANVFAMYVRPDARGRGVGELLVEAVVDWARRESFERIRLMVNVENGAAMRLYARCGFRDTGVREPLRDTEHTLAELARPL